MNKAIVSVGLIVSLLGIICLIYANEQGATNSRMSNSTTTQTQ